MDAKAFVDVVWVLKKACDRHEIPYPTLRITRHQAMFLASRFGPSTRMAWELDKTPDEAVRSLLESGAMRLYGVPLEWPTADESR